MEKYRSSADPSTGVHPFIPTTSPPNSLLVSIVRPLLIVARFPILLLSALLYFFASIPVVILSTISPLLARPFARLRDIFLLRVILATIGCWRLSSPELGRPRTRAAKPGRHPGRGDLIYVNHASYLDVLYLACMYSPVFVHTYSGVMIPSSIGAALQAAMAGKVSSSAGQKTLSEISAQAAGPVVLFAEGTMTNGKGVLAFASCFRGVAVPDNASVYALGLSYSSTRKETFTIGSIVSHLVRLLGSTSSTIRGKALAIPSQGSDPQATVASLAGVPPLRISAEARDRFEEHWAQTHGK